jgi:hypothetical protein
MTTFVDKKIIAYTTTSTLVDWATKETKTISFEWLCDYWSTSKRDLQETNLSRSTVLVSKDVSIDGFVNNITIWDKVELFDINEVSIWLFVISELDKRISPKWRASNTFMRVNNRDV